MIFIGMAQEPLEVRQNEKPIVTVLDRDSFLGYEI
jgi:hypothetical protein